VNALLGGAADASASVAPAMFTAPGETAPKAPAPQPAAPVVRRPRVYYRWKDANGFVHVEQAPPATGEFTTIRSTD
jgi:hypothetical protein